MAWRCLRYSPDLESQKCDSKDCIDKRNNEIVAMNLLSGLNKLRKEGTFCDITLRVGEKTIRAHKLVISVSSAYFKAMFTGTFLESGQQEITIKEIDADSLELLVDYMYTGKLSINSDNVKGLLLTASFLQITVAKMLCCQFIERVLHVDNCIEYLLLARRNSTRSLVDSCLITAINNFHYIFFKDEYLELEYDEVKEIAKEAREIGFTEDLLYSFLMRWINYSYETRVNFTEDLLQLLNPFLITPKVLHSSEIAKSSNPAFTAWAGTNNAANPSNDPDDYILVTSGTREFQPLIIPINSPDKQIRQIEKLRFKITHGSYVCHGYYIYHQGGWSNDELVDVSYVYHPDRSMWAPFVPLQEARKHHRSCVLNGRIFNVGGSNGPKALSSVEYTDLCTGQRGFTEPLPYGKQRTGLALHGDSMYVVGGCDHFQSYSSIHRYDVREGVWQELAQSPYRTGASTCAVIGEHIYTTHSDTLQRYDMRANNWAVISAEDERYPQEIFALDNTLFGLFNDHIARFSPEGSKWEYKRNLEWCLPDLHVATNMLVRNVN